MRAGQRAGQGASLCKGEQHAMVKDSGMMATLFYATEKTLAQPPRMRGGGAVRCLPRVADG